MSLYQAKFDGVLVFGELDQVFLIELLRGKDYLSQYILYHLFDNMI